MKALLLPVSLLTLLSTAAFAQDYAIKLHRSEKPGNEYKASLTGKEAKQMTLTVDGAVQKDQKSETLVQFDGTEKVLEVSAIGKQTKLALTVEKFTSTTNGTASDVFPKGTVITATRDSAGKKAYEIDGKPVTDPSAVQALGLVVAISRNQTLTDDDIFGTPDRKKKGDSWDINAAKAKEDFEKAGDGAEIDNLAGKFTLDDVQGDTMIVSSHITGGLKPPLPPMFTIDQSAFDMTLKGLLPVDPTQNAPSDGTVNMSFNFSAHGDGPSGKKIEVKVSATMTMEQKLLPVK